MKVLEYVPDSIFFKIHVILSLSYHVVKKEFIKVKYSRMTTCSLSTEWHYVNRNIFMNIFIARTWWNPHSKKKKKERATHATVLKENLESLGWENWKQTVYGWPPEISALFQAFYAHVWMIMCFRLMTNYSSISCSAKKSFLVTVTDMELYVYLIKFTSVRSDVCLLSDLFFFLNHIIIELYLFLPLKSISTKWYGVI